MQFYLCGSDEWKRLKYETSDVIKRGVWIPSQRNFYTQGKLQDGQVRLLEKADQV